MPRLPVRSDCPCGADRSSATRPATDAGLVGVRSATERRRLAPRLALILAAACWGAGTVVSKQAVAEIRPLTLLPIQLGASVVRAGRLSRSRGASPARPGARAGCSAGSGCSTRARLRAEPHRARPDHGEPLGAALGDGAAIHPRCSPRSSWANASGVAIVARPRSRSRGSLLVVCDPAAGGVRSGVVLTVAGVVVCAVYTVAHAGGCPARRTRPSASFSPSRRTRSASR